MRLEREAGARLTSIYLTGDGEPLRVFEQGSAITRAGF